MAGILNRSSQRNNEPVPDRREHQPSRLSRRGDYMPTPSEFLSNPFGVMRRMHEEMDRVFAESFGSGREGGQVAWAPAVEIAERDNKFIVCAELPGMNPEDVQIEIIEDALVLQGERKMESTSGEGKMHRTERRYGSFQRVIPLPEGVDADRAQADYRNGVLEISMPMQQPEQRRRRISIGTGSATDRARTAKAGESATGQPLS
ncbi:MAG: Hsp20/alpha crystallin family protein [Bryobacterales bacterium]|nr:Hsp20/alpha crystallin family protein [Bryobacterales bacterium]